MSAAKQRLKSAIIDLATRSGLPKRLSSSFGGLGAILALHRVRPASDAPFQPNRSLEVTPDFLDRTLTRLREARFDIIGLDEMERRLRVGMFERRFVCLTLDDGYRDNVEHAYPIFKAHDAPFSIYLTTGFVEGTAFFWWLLLETVIRDHDEVALRIDGKTERRPTRTLEEKEAAFGAWHRRFRELGHVAVETAARHLCEDYGIDPAAFHKAEAMTWEMARKLTEDRLGTIEAHTERHIALSLLTADDITDDMSRVRGLVAERTGRAPRHFAYPFGDRQAVTVKEVALLAGLPIATATTTRAGVLRPHHRHGLSALPRLELNGCYQSENYVDFALSGLPSSLSLA